MQFKKLLNKTLKWKCEIVLLLLLIGVLVFKLYKHKEEFYNLQDNEDDTEEHVEDILYIDI